MNGKFYENNIVIQYDKDLIEVWDEAKRLRCEWYNDYEKGITKPPIRVSDLEVVELNFRGKFYSNTFYNQYCACVINSSNRDLVYDPMN